MRSAFHHRMVAVFLSVLLPAGVAWAQSVCPPMPTGSTPTITISPTPSGLNNTAGLIDCVPNQFAVIDYSGLPLQITFTFPAPVTLTGFAGIAGGIAPNYSTAWDNSWEVLYLANGNYHWPVVDARSPATFDYVSGFKFATLGFAQAVTAQQFIVRATRERGDRKVHLAELRPLFAAASAQPGEDICALLGTSNRPAFCPSNPPNPLSLCTNVTQLKQQCNGPACVELYSATCSTGSPQVYFARGTVTGGPGANGTWPLMGVSVKNNGDRISEATTHFVNRSDVYGNLYAPPASSPAGSVEACVHWSTGQFIDYLEFCA